MSDEPLPALAAEPLNHAPHSVPAPVDHRSMVEALALCAAGLGWHAVAAKQDRHEVTFICRPDRP